MQFRCCAVKLRDENGACIILLVRVFLLRRLAHRPESRFETQVTALAPQYNRSIVGVLGNRCSTETARGRYEGLVMGRPTFRLGAVCRVYFFMFCHVSIGSLVLAEFWSASFVV